MITTTQEYEAAKSELSHLEDWLSRLQREHPAPSHRLSKAGIRKMIARLHEELAIMKGARKCNPQSDTQSRIAAVRGTDYRVCIHTGTMHENHSSFSPELLFRLRA